MTTSILHGGVHSADCRAGDIVVTEVLVQHRTGGGYPHSTITQ
jgi:hypothetical protein